MALTLEDIVNTSLREKGIYVSKEWIKQSVSFVKSRKIESDQSKIANHIYKLFLYSDYNETYNTADLDESLSFLFKSSCCIICKPLVFQIDEVTNVGASYDQKLNPNCSRLLKLYLVIGNKKFVGIEMNRIAALNVNMVAGTKILVHGSQVRRNCVMLTAGNVQVLGGEVERLSSIQAQIKSTEMVRGGKSNNNNILTQGGQTQIPPIQIPSTSIQQPQQQPQPYQNSLEIPTPSPAIQTVRPELQSLRSNPISIPIVNSNGIDCSRLSSSSIVLSNHQNNITENINQASYSNSGNHNIVNLHIKKSSSNKQPIHNNEYDVNDSCLDMKEVEPSILPQVNTSTDDVFEYEINTEAPHVDIPEVLDLMSLSPVSSQTYLQADSSSSSSRCDKNDNNNNSMNNSNNNMNNNNNMHKTNSTRGLRNTTSFISTVVQDLVSPIDVDKHSGSIPSTQNDGNDDTFELSAINNDNNNKNDNNNDDNNNNNYYSNNNNIKQNQKQSEQQHQHSTFSSSSSVVDVTDNVDKKVLSKKRIKQPITLTCATTAAATTTNMATAKADKVLKTMIVSDDTTIRDSSSSSSLNIIIANPTSSSSSSSSSSNSNRLSTDDLHTIQSAPNHYFKYFKFPESELINTSVPIRAGCNGITKFKVVNNSAFVVWLKMDDQDSEEIIAIHNDIVMAFLNMTPHEYEMKMTITNKQQEQEQDEQQEEDQQQKSFRASIGLKFRDFVGVFQTQRIDLKNTLTIKEQKKYKGPLLEFIKVDYFEDLSNQP